MNQFKKAFASKNAIIDLLKKTILMVPADYVSRTFMQQERFTFIQKNGVKHIVFLQNEYRLNQIQRLYEAIVSGENCTKVTGSRGTGKSHFLALFTLHLRLKILHESSQRIMYINDPELYFQNFSKIKDDIALFMANDYTKDEKFRKELENAILLGNVDLAYEFMQRLIKYYSGLNIKYHLVIDQFNNLESKRNKDPLVYNFFNNLMRLFGNNVVISASNDNQTLREFRACEIQLSPKDFLKNDDEALQYLESLNYFEELFKNKNKEDKLIIVQQIKEITSFNPYEMMSLNEKFSIFNSETIDEELIEEYERKRFDSIQISHKKFVKEVLNNDQMRIQWFLQLYINMNSGMKIIDKDLFKFVDLNIMFINDDCIYSIAPVYVKSLKRIYSLKVIRKLMPNFYSAHTFALDN